MNYHVTAEHERNLLFVVATPAGLRETNRGSLLVLDVRCRHADVRDVATDHSDRRADRHGDHHGVPADIRGAKIIQV